MKLMYACQGCGYKSAKWLGQCPGCQEWNTLEQVEQHKSQHYAGSEQLHPVKIADIKTQNIERIQTVQGEFNRVLGGGLVPGSVVLLGGDPGIGKSTLLLDVFLDYAKRFSALYITGEESLEQVALRAKNLVGEVGDAMILSATNAEQIMRVITEIKPRCVVIDSIQTLSSDTLNAASGSVSQVRHATGLLVSHAKKNQCSVLIVGHMTKDGQIAGPKVLEHMVDTVLYFEGDSNNRYRVIRTVKNRFGPAHEIGVFAMTDKGVKSVNNPSKIFMHSQEKNSGSIIGIIWNGSRPLLLEIQALVTPCYTDFPRRIAVGFDQNRLGLLLAILQKHAGLNLAKVDVFVNVVGGLKVTETAADLAVIAAIVSSFNHQIIDSDTVFFGEVGLTGEVRPVLNAKVRMNEISKQGMKRVVAPVANIGQDAATECIAISSVRHIGQLIARLQRSAQTVQEG